MQEFDRSKAVDEVTNLKYTPQFASVNENLIFQAVSRSFVAYAHAYLKTWCFSHI